MVKIKTEKKVKKLSKVVFEWNNKNHNSLELKMSEKFSPVVSSTIQKEGCNLKVVIVSNLH